MRSRRPYHHGDLRQALLRAATDIVAEVGPRGFTLREVARRAGVSHNAPYRHFRDKEELVAAVAAEGFRELTQAMLDAAASQPTALDRLRRSGLAYVAFALRRPEHFTVMFDTPVSKADYPECTEAANEAFGTLVRFIEACQRDGPLPPGDTLQRALAAWSLVHGIAKLAVAKRLPFRSRAAVLHFAESTIGGSLSVIAWGDRDGVTANAERPRSSGR
ncbi:MAG TPA: TetR/AcrR family transcriptional regulator [bacterium]|nr:TetR/AcrR family transcriptional regulator [bacterium]